MAATMNVNEMNLSPITENATKIEETGEILGKNELFDYGGKTIEPTTEKIIGCWTKLMVPFEGGFNCRIQPVMKAKTAEDREYATLSLDIEGAHTMAYTPWKLVNKTSDTKIWIHDDDLITKRNKIEEQWKLKKNQLESIESASDASFEHAEGE